MAAVDIVAYQSTTVSGCNSIPPTESDISVATIDDAGALSNIQAAIFSDSFTGTCHRQSASATEFLCWDGTYVRHYRATESSGTIDLDLRALVPISSKSGMTGTSHGGTFAWDGNYYYFAKTSAATGRSYYVFDSIGTDIDEIEASIIGVLDAPISALYYDWSVKRYSFHDGFGYRRGGTEYGLNGVMDDDSQGYGYSVQPFEIAEGPAMAADYSGWSGTGMQFDALTDATLKNFAVINQGAGTEIQLINHTTEAVLETYTVPAGEPEHVVAPDWELTEGVSYRLKIVADEARYRTGQSFPVTNEHIVVNGTVAWDGTLYTSWWSSFVRLTTEAR